MAAMAKVTIVDAAESILNEDELACLREFNEFLASNKMTPRDTKSGGTWAVKHKNKAVCHIRLDNNERSWNISFSHFTREDWFVDYDQYIKDSYMKQVIWDNLKTSPSPNKNCIKRECKGMENITILGKNLNNVCRCVGVRFFSPSGSELENIKQLVLVIKQYIADLAAVS